MNLMEKNGFKALIQYDENIDMFRGEILGLNGGADFYGKNADELRTEFEISLSMHLELCKRKGITAEKKFSGKLPLRMPPELHEKITNLAKAEQKSINAWIVDLIEKASR